MSSCYQFNKVLLTNFCQPKIFIFGKLYADMMNLFGRSSSRRRSSGASSSDSSARRSYVEPSESSTRDAATKTCLWPCDDYMMRVGIKEEFGQYVHNAGLGPYLSDKCEHVIFSLNHLSKDLNIFHVSLGCRLCFMIIHLLFH